MIRVIEDLGFDSIWAGDHFLYHMADGTSEAPWDAWSTLAAAAAITSRVSIGPLVTPIGFYNPAVLAKKAATVDEISGGRLILGLGAGWNDVEFRGYGVPFDHRISRFEESFTIVRTLLQEGEIGRASHLDRLPRRADARNHSGVRQGLERVAHGNAQQPRRGRSASCPSGGGLRQGGPRPGHGRGDGGGVGAHARREGPPSG
jgi:alkanesulfonate monooxygenase SsuD/methylene tetrahydromethanopterin reductase-like flavin-dependent oxidoreductase (luciferase family)